MCRYPPWHSLIPLMIDPSALPVPPATRSPINRQELSNRLMGDAMIMDLIIRSFADNFDKQLNAIRSAVAAQDMGAISRAAHSLKGAAGNLSAETLQAACDALEKAALTADSAAVNACSATLEQAASDLRSVLPS